MASTEDLRINELEKRIKWKILKSYPCVKRMLKATQQDFTLQKDLRNME